MKRIAFGVLAAWGGIVALAWWLASERLRLCPYRLGCDVTDAAATRDNVLVWGLAIPLFVFVALCVLGIKRLRRDPRSPIATPELRPTRRH